MTIHFDLAALRKTKWYEFALRALFGGSITVFTGVIAHRYGPVVGGLFLAFPAIFPASATLVEKHAKQEMARAGLDGTMRGRDAASLDARGAAMGTLGLMAFATVVWKLLPQHSAWLVLAGATVCWFAVAATAWRIRRAI
jgi:hypothetical protein